MIPIRRGATWVSLVAALGAPGCDERGSRGVPPIARAATQAAADPQRVPVPTPRWPALPKDVDELDLLLGQHTRRPPRPWEALTAERVVAALGDGIEHGTAAMGWTGIVEALGQRLARVDREGRASYLLFGHHHDAPAQLEAFRRITGPLGLTPAPLAAVEQLQADGHWRAVPPAALRGDTATLAAYLTGGEVAALEVLRNTQRWRNYTAWKYDYVETIVDLVMAAKAGDRRLVGCDMPSQLQAQVSATLGERGGELRDLHCALTLRDELDGPGTPHRVALFWGNAHLAPDRLPRFLPAGAELWTIELLGGRLGGAGIEVELARRLQLLDPTLLPVGDRRFVLVLPARPLAAPVDRVRTELDGPLPAEQRNRVVVHGLAGASLRVGPQQLARPTDGASVELPAGASSFCIHHDGRLLAGGLSLPKGGQIELHLEPDGTLRMVTRTPPGAPR